MNFGELRAWVLRTVKRPELSIQVGDAINSAIEIAAAHGDYSFDLVEGTLSAPDVDSSSYVQNIVISDSFPRFRKAAYFRPTTYADYLKWKDPRRVFQQGRESVDVWYRAGDSIKMKLSHLVSSIEYGFFAYPARLTGAQGTNEYTEMMSSAIHDIAAGRVFEDIGNEAEASRLGSRGLALLSVHKADKMDGVSHS